MKKLLSISLTSLSMCVGALGCIHVHTEECKGDGINGIHECYQIIPYNNENRTF